jgi:hypothetical protein
MSVIVLDERQARALSDAKGRVEVRDTSGRHLGFITPGVTKEDVAIVLARRSTELPVYTTQQVLEHLLSLESK